MKITNEELKKIKEIRNESSNLIIQLGQLKIEKINLKKKQEILEDRYLKLIEEENLFYGKLNYRYGQVTIDVETGQISPIETTTTN